MTLSLSEAVTLLEISNLEDLRSEDLKGIRKRAMRRWHPDRIAHTQPSQELRDEYETNFKRIDEALDLVAAFLAGESQAEFRTKSRVPEHEVQPEEIVTRNAPANQERIRSVWDRVKATAFEFAEENVTVTEGVSLREALNEDLRDRVPSLATFALGAGAILFLLFFIGAALAGVVVSMFAPAIAPLIPLGVGVGWLVQVAACLTFMMPLSRFWLPPQVTEVVITIVNTTLNAARGWMDDPEGIGKFVYSALALLSFAVHWLIAVPLYTLAGAVFANKVIGRNVVRIKYYSGYGEHYIDRLLGKNVSSMTLEELFDLSHIWSSFSRSGLQENRPHDTTTAPRDTKPEPENEHQPMGPDSIDEPTTGGPSEPEIATYLEFLSRLREGKDDGAEAVSFFRAHEARIREEYGKIIADYNAWLEHEFWGELLPLGRAPEPGKLAIAHTLIREKVLLEVTPPPPQTALCYLAISGDLDLVKAALRAGADPNAGSDFSPLGSLMFVTPGCVRENWRAVADCLLENGASVDGVHGRVPPLFLAIQAGLEDRVRWLIDKGAKLNEVFEVPRWGGFSGTSLHWLVRASYEAKQAPVAIAKRLIEAGADLSVKNRSGLTPLELAATGIYAGSENVRSITEVLSPAGISPASGQSSPGKSPGPRAEQPVAGIGRQTSPSTRKQRNSTGLVIGIGAGIFIGGLAGAGIAMGWFTAGDSRLGQQTNRTETPEPAGSADMGTVETAATGAAIGVASGTAPNATTPTTVDSGPGRADAASYHYVTGLDPNGDNWLALKAAPNSASERLLRLPPDTLLTVISQQDPWRQVRLLTGEIGWVHGSYIACCRAELVPPKSSVPREVGSLEPFTPATPHFVKGDDVRFRERPLTTRETPVLGKGNDGDPLSIVGRIEQPDGYLWYQIRLADGRSAFVHSDLVTATPPMSARPSLRNPLRPADSARPPTASMPAPPTAEIVCKLSDGGADEVLTEAACRARGGEPLSDPN